MREIVESVNRWFDEGCEVALACVVRTWGSSPRPTGSLMAISSDGRIAGSVSGGCIEGAVVQSALAAMEGGSWSVEQFHADTARAQEVGLSCGGNVDVAVMPYDRDMGRLEQALLEADRTYLRVTVLPSASASESADADAAAAPVFAADTDAAVHGKAAASIGDAVGSFLVVPAALVDDELLDCGVLVLPVPDEGDWAVVAFKGAQVAAADADALQKIASEVVSLSEGCDVGTLTREGASLFFQRVKGRPTVVCVGGTHVAVHLAALARVLGYRTVVVDPRGIFAGAERFEGVDELVRAWPQAYFAEHPLHEGCAVCALTHDPKIDVPAVAAALDSDAFYIGSLGRITTQKARCDALRDLGCADAEISRVFGPIGLDLAGREPAEIALSIMAEITAVRHRANFESSTMLESARRVEEEERRGVEHLGGKCHQPELAARA